MAASKVAEEMNILLLPGLELETSEEIHLLCYFPSLGTANRMQLALEEFYQRIPNREDIFGPQWILNEEDELKEKVGFLLTASTKLDLYQAVSMVRELGGAVVPAHVDRESYSILSNLGSIPEDLFFKTLEISRYTTRETFLEEYPDYGSKQIISSSDAHDLGMILEKESFIELEELSIDCLFKKLK
jgi:PHP family Zn ribbon phosphoesterase